MIHYSVSDSIAEIRIDHPPVNGLGVVMIDDLIAALGRAAAADDVRVVLITSAVPRRFCAGLDLDAVLNDVSALRGLVDKLYVRLADAQQALGKPSIAVVNGAARGGGMTLAISCDVVIAGASATFGYPEIDVGLLPAIHFVQLPRVSGGTARSTSCSPAAASARRKPPRSASSAAWSMTKCWIARRARSQEPSRPSRRR